jgi:hypothetical protein
MAGPMAGPMPGPMAGPMAGPPGGPGGRPGMPPWMMRRRMHAMNQWSLIYTPDDRALTDAEVQKIAEAFLLWHGNRSWKVINVADQPDGKIAFAFATAEGGVIATFTMDRRTGRVARTG